MSPANPIRRYYPDPSRRLRADNGSARPNPRPARPRATPDPCCRATQASSPPPPGAVITPSAASSAAVASTAVSKSP